MPARRLGFRGLCRRTPGIPDRPSCSHWTRSAMSLPTRSMPTSSNSPRLASRAIAPSMFGLPHSKRRALRAGRQSRRS
ncbi:Uncharacterised protein [Acinetobacter baumannii]|nr:Uncharacterised protein [Acinetobacter baumannii]